MFLDMNNLVLQEIRVSLKKKKLNINNTIWVPKNLVCVVTNL